MIAYGYSSGGASGGIPYPPPSAVRVQRAGAWRSVVAVILVVLGCLLAPAALAGVWLHVDVLDVDGWVDTITPVADEPAVQEAVADLLSEQISGALDSGWTIPGLPDELNILPGSLTVPGLPDLTHELTLQAVSSSLFRSVWAAANRSAHTFLLDAVENPGDLEQIEAGPVGLDLGDITRNVTDLLAASGVSLPDVLPQSLTSGDVSMFVSRPLAKVASAVRALDLLYWLLPLVTVALLAGSLLVASRRSVILVCLGVGLELTMAALEAGVAWAGSYYLDTADEAGISHEASAALWRVVTSDIRLWGWVLLGVGLVVALAGAVLLLVTWRSAAPSGPPPNR